MGDNDYAVLLQAAGWIDHHAGVDACQYSDIEELSSVVSNIAELQETELPPPSQPVSTGDIVVHLVHPTGANDPGATRASATGPSELPDRPPA
jgi:hypothetical protein